MNKYLILLLLFLGLSVSFYFILSKMKKQDEDNEQIPRFSTLEASLISIGASFLVCSILFLIANKLRKKYTRSSFDNDPPPPHPPRLVRNIADYGNIQPRQPESEPEDDSSEDDSSEEDFFIQRPLR